jgi:hypothetical protein
MTRPSLITVAALLLAPCAATAQSFTAADGAPVTVTDSPGNSISPNYSIDFATMDADGNGDISRGEASSNPDLVREFHVVDRDHDGRLTREELKGWLD